MRDGHPAALAEPGTVAAPNTGNGLLPVLAPVLILALVLCARWILIVGFGDFGTDLDLVSRLAQGQWQGRDFFGIFPPGSGYSLLLFERLLGDQYVVINIHLWFWWFVNAVVGGGLMAAVGYSGYRAVFAAVAVGLLTAPPDTHTVSFAFIASALSGIAAILLIRHLRSGGAGKAILAGAVGGVAILAKPNAGVASVIAGVAVCVAMALFQPGTRRRALSSAVLIAGGGILGFFAALAIPGFYGGYRELLKEIFAGGAEIKGGVLVLLLRTMPRISTSMPSSHRYLFEALLTVPLMAGFVFLFAKAVSETGRKEDGQRPQTVLLWILCGVVVSLSAVSLLPWGVPSGLSAFFQAVGLVSLPFFLWQILYLLVLAALLVSVAAGVLRGELVRDVSAPLWISLLALIWTGGLIASGRHNSIFAATLFVPSIALRMRSCGRERLFYRCLTGFLVMWTLAWHVAPNWKSTFARLVKLPKDSKFAGLYWPEGGASVPGAYALWTSSRIIEELQRNVAPRVQGRSTLWLVPSVGAAFGGNIYRYGINGLSSNNVPVFAEMKFAAGVRTSPPDYIVASKFDEWNDPKWTFMRPDVVEPWLRKHYNLVWAFTDNPAPIYLWEKKS